MKHFYLLGIFVFMLNQFSIRAAGTGDIEYSSINYALKEEFDFFSISDMYDSLQGDKPSYAAFETAMKGFLKLKSRGIVPKGNILTLIDYSLSSAKKRLWVIDVQKERVLYNELVAHGMNSGSEYANHFSNIIESNMSSLGFFLTSNTYIGKHGLSLVIDGIEKGINDNARNRAIVIHMANYVSQSYITNYGRLGRSFGCPSLPNDTGESIINIIADGTCLFIYYPDIAYLSQSEIIRDEPMNELEGSLSVK
jgi:hypothetical protein